MRSWGYSHNAQFAVSGWYDKVDDGIARVDRQDISGGIQSWVGLMDVTDTYDFGGFGSMDVTNTSKLKAFGGWSGPGATTKRYRLIGILGWTDGRILDFRFGALASVSRVFV